MWGTSGQYSYAKFRSKQITNQDTESELPFPPAILIVSCLPEYIFSVTSHDFLDQVWLLCFKVKFAGWHKLARVIRKRACDLLFGWTITRLSLAEKCFCAFLRADDLHSCYFTHARLQIVISRTKRTLVVVFAHNVNANCCFVKAGLVTGPCCNVSIAIGLLTYFAQRSLCCRCACYRHILHQV